MISSKSATQKPARPRIGWTGAIGLAITLLLLWWALHDVAFAEVYEQIRNANPWWFVAAIAAATLTFPLRLVRWRHLLHYEGAALPYTPLWHAVAIGFMANNVLPARAGEFARAYAVRRLTGVRFSTAFASIAVERIFDGVTLVAFLVVGVFAGGFDRDATLGGMSVSHLATVGGGLFGALLLVSLAVVRWPQPMLRSAQRLLALALPHRVADRITDFLAGMIEGLSALGTPGRFTAVLFWSIAVWSMNGLSFWLGFHAFGIEVSWSAALLLQSVIAFGVAIPSSPGFFGVFEGATRASLALYGVPAGKAVSYAIGYHIGGFIPITLLGVYSLWRAGMTLQQLRTANADDPGAP